MEGDLQLYLTKMSPNTSKLCEGGQALLSQRTGDHWFRNKIIEKCYLVFVLPSLGGEKDVSRVKKGQ